MIDYAGEGQQQFDRPTIASVHAWKDRRYTKRKRLAEKREFLLKVNTYHLQAEHNVRGRK
jgi:hypothetical protein